MSSARKRKKKSKPNSSRTGSSKKFFVKNGQYFAVPANKIGVKSYNLPLRFQAESTYRSSFKGTLFTKSGKKKLVPYHANSMRNRLEKRHVAGSGTKVQKKQISNRSQIVIGDPANDRTRFRTQNRVHYSNKSVKLPTGFSNSSIIASKTSWIKKRQLD